MRLMLQQAKSHLLFWNTICMVETKTHNYANTRHCTTLSKNNHWRNVDSTQHWQYAKFNEVISLYHDFEGISNRFWFVMLSSFESVAAIMLIIGWRVRTAATILIAQTILTLLIYYPYQSTVNIELKAIYTFIYIYILIAGGGIYSLDRFRSKGTAIL